MTSPSKKTSQFPRTNELPSQSPLFWVAQKDRYLRQLLVGDIQELTGRRLLVYFANRFEVGSEIDHQDCTYIVELFGDAGGGPVDLLLETNGGSTDATESIISYIRSVCDDLRVIIANCAKSNGTLIALLGDSIVMGPASELGPIEPSVQGVPTSILVTPQVAAANFPLHKFGEYALEQTKRLATRLLSDGMMKGKPAPEIAEVVSKISTRDTYASHGSAIDAVEAGGLGLKVEVLKSDDEIWKRIWLLYCMYMYDCRKSRYLKIFEGQTKSTAIAIPNPPPQTPGSP